MITCSGQRNQALEGSLAYILAACWRAAGRVVLLLWSCRCGRAPLAAKLQGVLTAEGAVVQQGGPTPQLDAVLKGWARL